MQLECIITNMTHNRVNILGVGVSSTSASSVLAIINDQCQMSNKKNPFLIATVNPEFILEAQKDPEFKKVLNDFDLTIPDGVGLKFARHGLAIIPGRKLVEEILKLNKYKVFFLGGEDDVAQKMTLKYGGSYDKGEKNIKIPQRNSEIINKINKFKPDILLVAYGAPWQEKWLYANRHLLNAKVCIGVGGTFDYLTGKKSLPPEWVSKLGLEWLWRAIHNPRHWPRALRASILFPWKIWRDV